MQVGTLSILLKQLKRHVQLCMQQSNALRNSSRPAPLSVQLVAARPPPPLPAATARPALACRRCGAGTGTGSHKG